MNRCDIQILRIHVGYPAVTLVMPCNRELIKAKFMDIINHRSGDDALIASMVVHFDSMLDALTCAAHESSVALFVNHYGARCYHLPFQMPELVACDQTFKLDQIIARLNRLQRYWVLECAEGALRLYEGVEATLIEVHASHVVVDTAGSLFVRRAGASGLGDYFEQDRLPICLVGPADAAHECVMDSPFRERVVRTVQEMSDVWPAMEEYFAQRRADMQGVVGSMSAGVDYVTDLAMIVKEARIGAVARVFFEVDYHLDACEEEVTRQVITDAVQCPVGYQRISLIDQILESVCAKGGVLIPVPSGSLNNYGRLVAMVREW